ncbi:glycosyltransferase family 4 protein [Paracoccus sp. (in: a-proteobacteria)]|uniref:glycosyltransferase family 4 protein n=1 Tax=Paracoccus sp. TaxID=267 RepID=UPI003A8433A2
MAGPEQNAAIWYGGDGYDPDGKGINGRRVAGASFLKGFLRHAAVDEFVTVAQTDAARDEFLAQKNRYAPDATHRAVSERDLRKLSPVGTIYYPAPNFANLCWQRQSFGRHNHSICGITHTTATQAVMRGFFDLRAGPQAEWDAVICTSRAVRAATVRNIEIADDFLRTRFGFVPPRPQLPVIPLGINCDDFAHDPAARAALRGRMGWDDDDVAIVTISRLLPYGKFDPGPMFIALQQAAGILAGQRRLHYVACGLYADNHSRQVFEDCARLLMPDVGFLHLPGDDPVARAETLSGGDIFAFPIDNIQETFGLAPIEAMAAGLPVVVSDWDGMRDTIPPEVGMRISTRMVGSAAAAGEGRGHLSGEFSYPQYGNRLSMLTQIDLAEMTDAFTTLARDADLRRRMGAAGQARARADYDWRMVVPRLQDFWAELAAIRRLYATRPEPGDRFNPVAPSPADLFASYASGRLDRDRDRLFVSGTPARLKLILQARRYAGIGQPAETPGTLEKTLEAFARQAGRGVTVKELAKELGWNVLTVERCVLFFLKYGLITRAGQGER